MNYIFKFFPFLVPKKGYFHRKHPVSPTAMDPVLSIPCLHCTAEPKSSTLCRLCLVLPLVIIPLLWKMLGFCVCVGGVLLSFNILKGCVWVLDFWSWSILKIKTSSLGASCSDDPVQLTGGDCQWVMSSTVAGEINDVPRVHTSSIPSSP